MKFENTLRILLADTSKLAGCKDARAVWVRETAAAWRAAQRQMDERCDEAVTRLIEVEFERLFDAEQAKVDAFRAPLQAVAERDAWPRDLYWGGI